MLLSCHCATLGCSHCSTYLHSTVPLCSNLANLQLSLFGNTRGGYYTICIECAISYNRDIIESTIQELCACNTLGCFHYDAIIRPNRQQKKNELELCRPFRCNNLGTKAISLCNGISNSRRYFICNECTIQYRKVAFEAYSKLKRSFIV